MPFFSQKDIIELYTCSLLILGIIFFSVGDILKCTWFLHNVGRFFLTKDWLLCSSKNFCQERVGIMVYPIIQDENKALDKNLIPSSPRTY